MTHRLDPAALATAARPPAEADADPALALGTRLREFEVREVIARGTSSVVYIAIDHALLMPVALQEYLPFRLVRRDAQSNLLAIDPWNDDVLVRGLHAFIEEARLLAPFDHPALIKVRQLFEANGTAYRVMPLCPGQRLSDVRRGMVGAPDETSLRTVLDGLLGALDTLHRTGQVHGGVSPTNILLLADDRPLLLGAGAASIAIGSDLVDSWMARLESSPGALTDSDAGAPGAGLPPSELARDLYALAETMRFCIAAEPIAPHGTWPEREPLTELLAREFPADRRPQYSAALVDTLDAAVSSDSRHWPTSVAQFRQWLDAGVPASARPVAAQAPLAPTPPQRNRAEAAPTSAAPPPAPLVAPPTPAPAVAAAGSPAQNTAPAPAHPAAPEPFSFDRIDLPDERDLPLLSDLADERPWPGLPPLSIDPDARVSAPLPSSLRRGTSTQAPRRRLYKAALATALGVAAVVGIGLAAGGWNAMPPVSLDAPELARLAATTPTPPDSKRPGPPAPAAFDAAATPPGAEPAPAPKAVVTSEPGTDPTSLLTARPPAAGPARAAQARAAAPEAALATPRAACTGKTEFALYRCMVQQCGTARWSAHAQCAKLRTTDQVD